jgi:hypothetical protein
MGNTRTKIIAGAVLLAIGFTAAGSAMSTDVFGGGATLPAGAYVGFNFNVPTTPAKLSTNATTNHLDPSAPPALAPVGVASDSLFGAWATSASNKVSYCQTGSGNGKKIFDHTDGVSTSLLGSDFCTGASIPPASGFGASRRPTRTSPAATLRCRRPSTAGSWTRPRATRLASTRSRSSSRPWSARSRSS